VKYPLCFILHCPFGTAGCFPGGKAAGAWSCHTMSSWCGT